jgi:hypothetical protein
MMNSNKWNRKTVNNHPLFQDFVEDFFKYKNRAFILQEQNRRKQGFGRRPEKGGHSAAWPRYVLNQSSG